MPKHIQTICKYIPLNMYVYVSKVHAHTIQARAHALKKLFAAEQFGEVAAVYACVQTSCN